MGRYGLGVLVMKDNFERMFLRAEVLQSQHFPVEPLGNRFLLGLDFPQQSRPMELFGFGVYGMKEDLEEMIMKP